MPYVYQSGCMDISLSITPCLSLPLPLTLMTHLELFLDLNYFCILAQFYSCPISAL